MSLKITDRLKLTSAVEMNYAACEFGTVLMSD